jgi:hypothetical protein
MEQVPGLMGSVASKVPTVVSRVKEFDPKFDPRVGEQERLKNLTVPTLFAPPPLRSDI